jgi:hypothetical protein
MSRTAYNGQASATNFKEQVAISGGWLNSKYKNDMFKNPRYETASAFYVGKKPVNKPLQTQSMARPREGSLHTLRWSDKVFAGDTVNFTAKQALGARERDSKISASVGRQRVPDH